MTSTIFPTGPRAAVGQRVIATETMSFDLASPWFSAGIWTFHDQPAIEPHDESAARAIGLEPADDRCRAAFQDAEDASFGAAIGDAFDARDDAVAVHGLIQVAAGNVDIARHSFRGTVGYNETGIRVGA